MVKQALENQNNHLFSQHGLDLALQHNPHCIPILAQWLYKEWHPYDASLITLMEIKK